MDWRVTDYPEPKEDRTKTIKGKIYIAYKFEMEVPEEWDTADIKNDMYENLNDYLQDMDEIVDIDI